MCWNVDSTQSDDHTAYCEKKDNSSSSYKASAKSTTTGEFMAFPVDVLRWRNWIIFNQQFVFSLKKQLLLWLLQTTVKFTNNLITKTIVQIQFLKMCKTLQLRLLKLIMHICRYNLRLYKIHHNFILHFIACLFHKFKISLIVVIL